MISIGKTGNKDCLISLNKLITTRLLIQANSGSGKSWLLRKLLEQAHDKVQQIVIDLEGEFSTLREKYDYLLIGKEGEIPANIKTASLLARKLLEMNISAIIDLSDLKAAERITFVKRFSDSLINAPKSLWHPCWIVVDEAHKFAPEKGKVESTNSIIDLATLGRKRGICLICATQRLSKLHKDVAAECNNKIIGRTGLDIDRKRVSDELGFTKKEQSIALRNLKAGEFLGFGPAISSEIIKINVSGVETTHPEAGKIITKPIKTPENIKKVLKELIDLPKEAEEELKTKEDMKKKITELKREIRVLEHSKPVDSNKLIELKKQLELKFDRERRELKGFVTTLEIKNKKHLEIFNKIMKLADTSREGLPEPVEIKPEFKIKEYSTHKPTVQVDSVEPKPLKSGAMRMLNWLAGAYPNKLTKRRLAILSGFTLSGGTFGSYLSALRKNGWMKGFNNLVITEEGLENAKEPVEMPSSNELIKMWSDKFKSGIGKLLRITCERYPNSITKEDLSLESGFTLSGGTFGSYLSVLKRKSLIKVENNYITASSELFGDGQ